MILIYYDIVLIILIWFLPFYRLVILYDSLAFLPFYISLLYVSYPDMILTVVWFLLPCHVRPIFNSSTTLCVTPRYFLHRRWLHRRWLTLALNLKMSLTLTLTITLTLTLTLTLTRRTCLSAVMPHMIRSISLLPSVLLTLIRPLRAFYPDLPLTKGC